MIPSSSGERTRSLVANGLALIGILALVSVTSEGIERAQREREIQALESPGAGSAGAPAAGAASELDLPHPVEAEKTTSDVRPPAPPAVPVHPAQQPSARPEPSQGHRSATVGEARPDKPVTENPVVDTGSTSSDPFSSAPDRSAPAIAPPDLAAAKSELEKVTAQIESERQRWKDALSEINEQTANKTRPVREGSPAFHRCTEASKVIQEVETGAPALKARKAQLEERIKALEK